MVYRLSEKDLEKLYRLKIKNGKAPTRARYEVEMMRKLIKSHGLHARTNKFNFKGDAYLDYDEDGIMNAFDCQPLNFFAQETAQFYDHRDFSTSFNMGMPTDKYQVTTKYMTADEFLTLARKASITNMDEGKSNEQFSKEVLRQDKINQYAAAFKKGDKFPTPFLIYRGKSNIPASHEGRHRLEAAAKAFGKKKKFPVYIIRDPSEF